MRREAGVTMTKATHPLLRIAGISITTCVAARTTTTLAFAPRAPAAGIKSSSSSSFLQQRQYRYNGSSFASKATTICTRRNMAPTELLISAAADISLLSPMTCSMSSSMSSSSLLSFSDQGQNLAGIFFQASLLPYLTFLYFLGFRGNRTPNLGNFGFQYLLLFVLGTIPSGIITKSVYGLSLANVDWLHGGAEALLTMTNVMIVSSIDGLF